MAVFWLSHGAKDRAPNRHVPCAVRRRIPRAEVEDGNNMACRKFSAVIPCLAIRRAPSRRSRRPGAPFERKLESRGDGTTTGARSSPILLRAALATRPSWTSPGTYRSRCSSTAATLAWKPSGRRSNQSLAADQPFPSLRLRPRPEKARLWGTHNRNSVLRETRTVGLRMTPVARNCPPIRRVLMWGTHSRVFLRVLVGLWTVVSL